MKFIKIIFVFFTCIILTSSFDYQSFTKNEPEIDEWLPPTPEILELRERLDEILGSYDSLEYDFGLRIISLDEKRIFYEHQIDKPLLPASNQKIITTAAAMSLLGSDFKWQTEFFTDAEDNLHIKPNGDPTLFKLPEINHFFRCVADSLISKGISQIKGKVLIDPKGYNDSDIGAGWKEENRYYSYSAKPSVIAFYENSVQFKITPGAIGKKPSISVYPVDAGFEIVNKMNTISQNRQGITFDMSHDENQITFYGNVWHRSKPHYRTLATQKPDIYALEVVKKKLTENGISIIGDVLYAKNLKIETKKLFQIDSDKFIDVLNEINKKSNNFMANQLFLTIGNEYAAPYTTEHLIKYWLSENGIVADSLRMFDGSGLSTLNACTVNILSEVLKLMYDTPYFTDFHNSMSISGREGTLKNSLSNRNLYNKVYAKTGFIIGARALSGYIETLDNEMLAFSLIINKEGSHIGNFYAICEKILLQLALFEKEKLAVTQTTAGDGSENEFTPFDIDFIDEVEQDFYE